MKTLKEKLTLFNTVRYEIEVSGKLDEQYAEWNHVENIGYRGLEGNCPVTVLSCKADQAALIGIIRKLYNHGLPLISLNLLEG